MKKFITITTLCLGLGSLAACKKNMSHAEKIDKISNKINSELELNTEQSEKLKELTSYLKLRAQSLKEKRKEKRISRKEFMKKQLLAEKINKQEIQDFINSNFMDRKANFDKDLSIILVKLENFHASLNENQKEELLELTEKFQRKMFKRHKNHFIE